MRRILTIAVCALLMCSTAFAWPVIGGNSGKIYVYESINTSGTANAAVLVESSLMPAGAKIVGVSIAPYDNTLNAELWLNLWDIVTDGRSVAVQECIEELEANTNYTLTQHYEYPLVLETSLFIRHGPNSTVQIYYQRK